MSFFSDDKHVWHSKNKYYSRKINLKFCSEGDKEELARPAESNVGACIWFCESPGEADDTIKSLDSLQDDLRKRLGIEVTSKEEKYSGEGSDEDSEEDISCPVEVQLIVVESFQLEDTKTKVLQWTLKRGIEIIDLSEDEELQDEQNVNVFASSGQKRVLEALQTVMWPQLCPPEEPGQDENEMNQEMEDFEALFANLASFKEAAASLPDAERKKFAEKVAMSFYSALGEGEDSSEEEGTN